MKCPECQSNFKKVEVNVQCAMNKALSYQCNNCNYFKFEQDSYKKVIT